MQECSSGGSENNYESICSVAEISPDSLVEFHCISVELVPCSSNSVITLKDVEIIACVPPMPSPAATGCDWLNSLVEIRSSFSQLFR